MKGFFIFMLITLLSGCYSYHQTQPWQGRQAPVGGIKPVGGAYIGNALGLPMNQPDYQYYYSNGYYYYPANTYAGHAYYHNGYYRTRYYPADYRRNGYYYYDDQGF